ncbi:MAG TPA: RecX family transcriptional regulator [Candidatus Kapabacteria bacterium]|nr:RecX family transcriptional regulator [Candidatus Kapabacteria bacterium]
MEGRITSIQRQKKDSSRASIFLDEEFAFGVCDQTVEQFRLRKGDYIDRELFEKITDFDYGVEAKRIALHYLNYRARSEKEIRERLEKEDIPEAIVLRVLEFLKENRLVDDEAWSQSFVNDKLSRKPVSSKQLEFGLKQKGVSKEVIEETIANLNANESDEERALQAAEKRWPRIVKSENDPRKQKQKLYTFLAGRGFSFGTIDEVYKRICMDRVDEMDDVD